MITFNLQVADRYGNQRKPSFTNVSAIEGKLNYL